MKSYHKWMAHRIYHVFYVYREENIPIKAPLCILSLLPKIDDKNWWLKFVWEGQVYVTHDIIISSSIY